MQPTIEPSGAGADLVESLLRELVVEPTAGIGGEAADPVPDLLRDMGREAKARTFDDRVERGAARREIGATEPPLRQSMPPWGILRVLRSATEPWILSGEFPIAATCSCVDLELF